MIDPNKILFRSHRVGTIMQGRTITEKQLLRIDELLAKEKLTDKQAEELDGLIEKRDNEDLSEGVKTYLKLLYRSLLWDREKKIESKYLRFGLEAEQSALTLLSLEKKIFFKKNEERINNDWVTGVPDAYLGKSITECEEGYDVKCAYDWTTLPYKGDKIDPLYEAQSHSYMWLTGAKKWTVAHCLINHSASDIDDAKKRMSYTINSIDPTSDPVYIEKCKLIERDFIYDIEQFRKDYPWYQLENETWQWDIPRSDRLVTYEILRDEAKIEAIKERVIKCREWIKNNLI